MKRQLTVDGADCRIEILSHPPSCRFRLDDGPERHADVTYPEPGAYCILVDGKIYEAALQETTTGLTVMIDGYRLEIVICDPRRWTGKSGRAADESVQTITAPMPGKVVRVLVVPGQAVEAGQGLIVVEAMKMQNELKAPRPGRVLTISAKEGSTVDATEVLATLE